MIHKIGRPMNPNALKRVGKRFIFWLSPSDLARLTEITRVEDTTKADIIRRLIREFTFEK